MRAGIGAPTSADKHTIHTTCPRDDLLVGLEILDVFTQHEVATLNARWLGSLPVGRLGSQHAAGSALCLEC